VASYEGWAKLLLLTTIGAKSSQPRTTPIGYWQQGDGCGDERTQRGNADAFSGTAN
jgi:hypothetical protein